MSIDASSGQPAAPTPTVRASFDGEPIDAEAGASVAAAIMASRGPAWRTTKSGTGRGVFCGIGVCYDCIVEIDGESGQRSCMIPLVDGMDVRSAGGTRANAETVAARGARHVTPKQSDAPETASHDHTTDTTAEDHA